MTDLRLALRGFVRTPGFAAACVLTLAVGVGANTAIFSVVDSVLLRPLPYPDPDRLAILELQRADGSVTGSMSIPDYRDFRRDNGTFDDLAWSHGETVVLTGNGDPARLRGLVVSPNLLRLLGRQPVVGRDFTDEEGTAGKNQVVILSDAAWRRLYGGDRGVIGRSMVLDDVPHTVVGVMPPDFRVVTAAYGFDFLVPTPRAFDQQLAEQRGARILTTVGRLKPGVTLAAARDNLNALFQGYASLSPEDYEGRAIVLSSLHARLTRDVSGALWFLLGGVGLVLLIACANVASLLMTRANGRQRELAIRVALGAGRGRIVRQLLVESLLLAAVGGALGAALAVWGLEALRGWLPPAIVRFREIAVDTRVLGFTVGATLLTGLVFGLWPAFSAARADAGDALRHAAARATSHQGQNRARAVIVTLQVAFATLLLVASSLMLRSFQRLVQQSPGFDAENLVVGSLTLPDARYKEDADLRRFYRELGARLEALPGVSQAAIATHMPLTNTRLGFSLQVVGEQGRAVEKKLVANHHGVSPSYFRTMGIPLKAGRLLTADDDREDAPQVVVVNEALARAYFPAGDAIGHRIVLGGEPNPPREIVGIVGNVQLDTLEENAKPATYAAFGKEPWSMVAVAIRTAAPAGMAAALRGAVAAVDSQLAVGDLKTMSQVVGDSLGQRRLSTFLLGLFGAIALLLAVIGVYGVMSYSVAQKVPEIGLRIALGAAPDRVRREVLARGLTLAVAGVLLGLGGAVAVHRVVAGLLYGISATDPLTYVVAAVALLIVAALASWLPAARAARVDPMIAMRAD